MRGKGCGGGARSVCVVSDGPHSFSPPISFLLAVQGSGRESGMSGGCWRGRLIGYQRSIGGIPLESVPSWFKGLVEAWRNVYKLGKRGIMGHLERARQVSERTLDVASRSHTSR